MATGQRKAKGAAALRRGKVQEPAGSGGSGGIAQAEEKDACCSSAAGCEAGTVEEHCNRSI